MLNLDGGRILRMRLQLFTFFNCSFFKFLETFFANCLLHLISSRFEFLALPFPIFDCIQWFLNKNLQNYLSNVSWKLSWELFGFFYILLLIRFRNSHFDFIDLQIAIKYSFNLLNKVILLLRTICEFFVRKNDFPYGTLLLLNRISPDLSFMEFSISFPHIYFILLSIWQGQIQPSWRLSRILRLLRVY